MAGSGPRVAADDGFWFGLGAFETIALEDGRPVLLDAHLRRLAGTLGFLGIPADRGELREMVLAAAEEAATPDAPERQALKLTVTPENRLVTVRPNNYTRDRYERGFSCATSGVRRNETSPLVCHKTLNYGDCILEKRKARERDIDEPLFLNTRGELAEGATTNVFLVVDGRVVTPPVSAGLLPGVLRAWVLETCDDAEDAPVGATDLARCEQAFVTNSLLGVMPVRSIDGRGLSSMGVGRALLKRYRLQFAPGDTSYH